MSAVRSVIDEGSRWLVKGGLMMILDGGDDRNCTMKRSSSWLFISLLCRGVLRQLDGLTPLGAPPKPIIQRGGRGRECMTSLSRCIQRCDSLSETLIPPREGE